MSGSRFAARGIGVLLILGGVAIEIVGVFAHHRGALSLGFAMVLIGEATGMWVRLRPVPGEPCRCEDCRASLAYVQAGDVRRIDRVDEWCHRRHLPRWTFRWLCIWRDRGLWI